MLMQNFGGQIRCIMGDVQVEYICNGGRRFVFTLEMWLMLRTAFIIYNWVVDVCVDKIARLVPVSTE